ncbi:uncharacterized protein LOC131465320 [Solea solea]|uniref:uncharacterized protein LOC131465320 n=1 Tax=Solea solea TaxID=90069 RepID=UPI00272BD1EB|nr:uncharacterized protein LOC131465320 [Solea solea]
MEVVILQPTVGEQQQLQRTGLKDTSPVAVCHPGDHDYCSSTEPAALDLALDQIDHLRGETATLRKRVEEISVSSRFGLQRFAASDDDIWFYTRFLSYNHLMAFWRHIEPETSHIVYVTSARSNGQTYEVPYTAGATSLQPIDEFFLFMNYMSLGLMLKDLSHRFKIHPSTVSRIINTWANFLFHVLGAMGIWLSKKSVKALLPDVFYSYSDTQVVLDCVQLRCQTPDAPLLQREMFSNYKSHYTLKGLIGMAPHGAVTFVSSLHDVSTSDNELLRKSGLASLLKPSAAIMMNKDFQVDDCISCKVYMVTSPSRQSEPEFKERPSHARLRVHVERLVQRVKEHQIFSTVIPASLAGSVNQLYTVACLLVNYQHGPLVKLEELKH